MDINTIIDALISSGAFIVIKYISIILMILHVLFSLIVVRQTQMMTKVLEAKISPLILLISIIHLLASIFVLFWAILFL